MRRILLILPSIFLAACAAVIQPPKAAEKLVVHADNSFALRVVQRDGRAIYVWNDDPQKVFAFRVGWNRVNVRDIARMVSERHDKRGEVTVAFANGETDTWPISRDLLGDSVAGVRLVSCNLDGQCSRPMRSLRLRAIYEDALRGSSESPAYRHVDETVVIPLLTQPNDIRVLRGEELAEFRRLVATLDNKISRN